MVEEKAVQALVPAHEVQLVNYLTATGIEIRLLLNFGSTFGIQAQEPDLS
jgi:GxxExxY protein